MFTTSKKVGEMRRETTGVDLGTCLKGGWDDINIPKTTEFKRLGELPLSLM